MLESIIIPIDKFNGMICRVCGFASSISSFATDKKETVRLLTQPDGLFSLQTSKTERNSEFEICRWKYRRNLR